MRTNTSHALLALLATAVGPAVAQKPLVAKAAQWQPAAPTARLDPHDRAHLQFSPRPTESPKVDANELRRRADTSVGSNTCGFLTDNDSAFPCPAGNTCTNSGHFRACCRGADCSTSTFSSVCLDSTASACSGTPGSGTMCCTETEHPFCVTYLWATTATPNQVFSLFVCDTETWAGQQILNAEPGEVSTTSDDSSSSTTSSKTASSSGAPVQSAPSGNEGKNNDDGGNKTPVGPIVGGVVGGVAVIGIIALLAFYLISRNRKTKQNEANNFNNGGAIGGNNVPPSEGYGSPPPQHAPPMSMYAPSGYQAVSSYGPSPSLPHSSPDQGAAGYAYQDQSKLGPQYGQEGHYQQGGEHLQGQSPDLRRMSEVPANNPLGMGANHERAELAS